MPSPADSRCLSGTVRFALLPEQANEMLRLLGTNPVDWVAVAESVLRSPGLLCTLFNALPHDGSRLGRDLKERAVERLETVGVELLRAWLLQESWTQPGQVEAGLHEAHARALFTAECALHLALESRYPHPDEAYLVGLWHGLDQLLVSDDAMPSGKQASSPPNLEEAARIRSTLLEWCGFTGPMLDVFAFGSALEEQLRLAHPLSRLLRAALDLGADDWQKRSGRVADLCALSPATIVSLRTDVAYIAQPQAEHGALAPTAPSSGGLPSPRPKAAHLSLPAHVGLSEQFLKRAALAGCIRNAFAAIGPDRIGARLDASCWLVCRIRSPLFVSVDDEECLKALPLGDKHGIHSYFNELNLRLDDETSVIALALRTGKPVSSTHEEMNPGRTVSDWHVQQWLGGSGLVCLPLHGTSRATIVLLGVNRNDPPMPDATETLVELCHEALTTWSLQARESALESRLKSEIESRFRDHARKVVHEASNPLTVIKAYLEVMPEKHPEARGLGDELKFLRSELERLGQLFKQAAYPPDEANEPTSCHVHDLMQDMQSLYGETLFARRGIQFDLRVTPGLPAVGIPASVLKQVLLNLFRNAAEALQPGKRFSVVVPGLLMVNGARCVEIRVIDNGPGLPAERMSQLFSQRASDKGGDHQGLGLAIVNDLLSQWRSSILCRSQPGTGTSFQLLVPAVESS